MANMCTSIVFLLLVAFQMGSSLMKAPRYHIDQELKLFDSSDLYEPKMPEACEGKSYCFEKGDNYPEETIAELLENLDSLIVETPENRIGDRSGSDPETDCPSETNDQPIYYITDVNDKVRVVVQSKDKKKNFEQIYSVKTCKNEGPIEEGSAHFIKSSHLLSIFKLECVSSTMDLDFFVLSDEVDPKTDKPKMEVARAKGGIPVCCKCRYNLD